MPKHESSGQDPNPLLLPAVSVTGGNTNINQHCCYIAGG
jgi:hypothetical protein